MPQRPAWYAWLYFVLVSLLAFGGTILASVLAGRQPDPAFAWLVKCTLVMALVVALTHFYLRRDRLDWTRYGVRVDAGAAALASIGLACGLFLALGWAAVLAWWAPFHWQFNPGLRPAALLAGTLATVAIGIAEEVGYRSYGMERLQRRHGAAAAVLLPTLIFTSSHLSSGMGWLPALLVVGSGGLMYASLMLATRSLPFVVAFHIANNLGQDALLRTSDASIWHPVLRQPESAASHSLEIWLGMAVLNLAVAGFAWRHRRTWPAEESGT